MLASCRHSRMFVSSMFALHRCCKLGVSGLKAGCDLVGGLLLAKANDNRLY